MVKTVYISVPMAGKPNNGLEHARMIEDVVRAMGAQPVVPHDVVAYDHDGDCPPGYSTHEGHSSACWLRNDLIELLECDYVVFGHGWEHSTGCRLEMQVAASTGVPIHFVDGRGEVTDTQNNVLLSF